MWHRKHECNSNFKRVISYILYNLITIIHYYSVHSLIFKSSHEWEEILRGGERENLNWTYCDVLQKRNLLRIVFFVLLSFVFNNKNCFPQCYDSKKQKALPYYLSNYIACLKHQIEKQHSKKSCANNHKIALSFWIREIFVLKDWEVN